jgi:nicotinamide-nucleotide amidase
MEKVFASIITIGDELLIGQVVDTNSAWIAQELNKNGISLKHRVAVGDVWDDIWAALDEESKHASLVIITGGLGPTADDITKPLLCKYFGGKMVVDQPTLEHVTKIFNRLNRPMIERNAKQAEVPDVCTVLKNERGTAPGMQFKKDGTIFISLPGVPHEMKWIMENQFIPQIPGLFKTGFIEHRTLLTYGIGESFLADLIRDIEESLPEHIKLAYLPNYGIVRLRLTSFGVDKKLQEEEIDQYFQSLKERVKEFLVTDEDIPMELFIAKLLKEKNETLSTAESCTGGNIARMITAHAGSSAYYKGTVVSYDNDVKRNVLHVKDETLRLTGAVSEETVTQMAGSVREIMQTDYSVAVSGIMGPGGGSEEKPVGLVWMAVANKDRVVTKQFQFRYDRARNIEMTSYNALNLLRIFINENR